MVSYKQPLNPGTSATDGLYTYCHIIDIDSTNKMAHVIDQLGNPRQVSITRSMGKQIELPKIGEDWIITRQYGDWLFAVCINTVGTTHYVPAGGAATSILTKVSTTDYDIQWALPVTAPTANTVPIRDANGRMQVADPAAPQDVSSKGYSDMLVPTGVIDMFAGASAPIGWALCDGSAISRTTFSALFALIGTTYGAGDSFTTFNLPNLKGKVPAGQDAAQTEFAALGQTGGAKTHAHTLTVAGVSSHTHTAAAHAHTLSDAGQAQVTINAAASPAIFLRRVTVSPSWTSTLQGGAAGASAAVAESTGAGLQGSTDSTTPGVSGATAPGLTGSSDSSSSLQPYLTINYIIKT